MHRTHSMGITVTFVFCSQGVGFLEERIHLWPNVHTKTFVL